MGKVKAKGNGEGTVFERPDRPGVFRAVFSYNDPETNEPKRKTFDRPSKREALAAGRKWVEQLGSGLLPDADKITLWQWLERWLADYVKPKVRTKSYAKSESCLRLYIKPYLGNSLMIKIKSPDVQRVFNRLMVDGGEETVKIIDDKEVREKKGVSTGTVRVTRRYLIMALDQAVRVGLLTKNVIKETEPPKLVKQEIHPLNKEQAAALTAAAKAAADSAKKARTVKESAYMAILLGLGSGMRLGEIFGLKWDCVDLEKGIIYVKRALETGQTKKIFLDPKTPKSRRQIPLPVDVAKELRSYKKRQDWYKHLLGDKWEDNDLVITNQFGRVLDTGNFTNREFKKLLCEAGINKPVKFHDLRHSHATMLLLAGVHPKIVSERLGHSTVQMTLDTYSHLLPDTQETAARALDGLFASSK